MKWIAGFPTNAAHGLRALHGLVVLNDPMTGVPTAILDGGPLTAHRTAAVSGLAIRAYAPSVSGRPARVGLIGAGVQGHSHVAVVAHLLPGAELALYDRDRDRTAALAEVAAAAGLTRVTFGSSAEDAVADADVVITAASFGPIRQVMPPEWLGPEALVVAVDYATYVSAALARAAALFVVDERGQFDANRDAGAFDDYPDPALTLGEALAAGPSAGSRPRGRIVVTHLGVGIADLIFADAIVTEAEARGLGTVLER
jgi:ornithine cyclodeaminase/alanine dehydrogenase-like protein (mu-crystallin family)